ncbi:MAG: Rrf2 family transcriptional regulator [Pirellulaceae bacterium]
MLFSQTVDYALRAVVFLASQTEHSSTIDAISETTGVPSPYLRKVLAKLRDAKILRTRRGIHGGVVLDREPDSLTVLDIVSAVDPLGRIDSCPLGIEGHLHLCPLHAQLNAAIDGVERILAERTIAELLGLRRSSRKTCRFPFNPRP